MKHLLLPLPPAPPQQHEACVLAMVELEPASNSSVLPSVLLLLAPHHQLTQVQLLKIKQQCCSQKPQKDDEDDADWTSICSDICSDCK